VAILTVEQVSKAYGDRVVLEETSFALDEGDRIGLIGLNGCGKSTLLRIVAGREEPDTGRVVCRRDLQIGYLEQEPDLPAGATVGEVLAQALAGRSRLLEQIGETDAALAQEGDEPAVASLLATRARLEEALERAGGWEVGHRVEEIRQSLGVASPTALVGTLSGGERRRLALARLLLQGPELLLLDEPTNHLDMAAAAWLEDFLRAFRGTLVLVTHDRYFLERLVQGILEIDRRQLYRYAGTYQDYLEQQAARLEAEAKAESSRLILLRRELAWMRRGPKARSHKAKARIQRFETLRDDVPDVRADPLALRIPDGPRLGNRILDLLDVSKSYGDRPLIRNLTLRTKPGDRIGIVGPNGAGKTTLLRLILGEVPPDRGAIEVAPRVQLVHASQTRLELDPERTVYQAVAENREHVTIDGEPIHVRGYLQRFLFSYADQETKVGRLSGGERNRLQLARLLRDGGNVVLLDEPTNDLDLTTLRALEEALLVFSGIVFVVSHDRYLLNRVATGILAFEEDGQVTLYEGDYDFYEERCRLRHLAAQAQALAQRDTGRARKEAEELARRERKKEGAPRRLTWAEQRELAAMEETILHAEEQVASLTGELEDPTLYRERAAAVPDKVRELHAAQARVTALYERWSELERLGQS